MAFSDIKLSDWHLREYPCKSYKTIQRWAREGRINGAHQDLGGNWVVDLSINKGIDFNRGAVNDTGLDDDVFDRLAAM
jgi:hypothetical protein